MHTELHPSLISNIPTIKIYSKRAIYAFSIIFCPIFGGVMLMQNLKDVGNIKAANLVLGVSILYTILCFAFLNSIDDAPRFLTYVLNFAGAGMLTEYFFKKHFNNNYHYELKPIWKPLIISVLIMVPFIWLIIAGY